MARYVVICSYAVSWKRNYKEERRFDCEENINKLEDKILSERMKAILLDGFQPPGITARYAIQHNLVYQGNGGYEHAGI